MNNKSWELYAHKYPNNIFMHVGSLNFVKAHMLDEPIIKVLIELEDNGKYWGWIYNPDYKDSMYRKDGIPQMIWPSKNQVEMCFVYGIKAEEDRGKGKLVRLKITEIEEENNV